MNADESSRLRRSGRLAFTPFETYLHAEDRVSYPCWMVLKCIFQGSLDHAMFQKAFAQASQLHPLTCARVESDSRGRLFWRLQPDEAMEVQFLKNSQTGTAIEFPPLDPTRENPVRILVVEDETGFELYFQVYHAAVDGLGGMQILHDALVFYERGMGRDLPLPERDVQTLLDRNRFLKGFWARVRAGPRVLQGLVIGVLVQRHSGSPLVPHEPASDDEPPPSPWPPMVSAEFPVETFQQLRAMARRHQNTTNDILLRDFQLAIGSWRRAHGFGSEDDWIRLAVPINLRKAEDRRSSAANVVSLVTIDRQMRSLKPERSSRLLFRVNEDMKRIQNQGLERLFLWMLAGYRWLPGGIAGRSRRNRCESTAIFTYLGRVLSVGPLVNDERKLAIHGAVMEELRLTAPLRPQSLVSVDAYVYARRLRLDMHYDPRFLSRNLANDLLARTVANIRESTGGTAAVKQTGN